MATSFALALALATGAAGASEVAEPVVTLAAAGLAIVPRRPSHAATASTTPPIVEPTASIGRRLRSSDAGAIAALVEVAAPSSSAPPDCAGAVKPTEAAAFCCSPSLDRGGDPAAALTTA